MTALLDLPLLFQNPAGMYVALSAEPEIHVVANSRRWLEATMTRREDMVGRPLFEVFPGNPKEDFPGIVALRRSLQRMLRISRDKALPVSLYQVMLPGEWLIDRYWKPTNPRGAGHPGPARLHPSPRRGPDAAVPGQSQVAHERCALPAGHRQRHQFRHRQFRSFRQRHQLEQGCAEHPRQNRKRDARRTSSTPAWPGWSSPLSSTAGPEGAVDAADAISRRP